MSANVVIALYRITVVLSTSVSARTMSVDSASESLRSQFSNESVSSRSMRISRLGTDVSLALGLLEEALNTHGEGMNPALMSSLKQIRDTLRQAHIPTLSEAPLSVDAVNTMAAHDPNVIDQQREVAAGLISAPLQPGRRYSQISSTTTATGMPAVGEHTSPSPATRRRQFVVSAGSSFPHGSQLHKEPPLSKFRRRLSTGHFTKSDIPLAVFHQRSHGVISGEANEDASPQIHGRMGSSEGELANVNGMLSVSCPSPGDDDRRLSRQSSDPCLRTSQGTGDPHDIHMDPPYINEPPRINEPCPVPVPSVAFEDTAQFHLRVPSSVGIPTRYLPSVLAPDMDYDGKGLVACGGDADRNPEDEMPDYEPEDGGTILSALTVPETAADAPLLSELDCWDYQIFDLACDTGGNVLSMLATQIFETHGLFTELQIPQDKFIAYFRALERGYLDNPYHNRIHAADVLQSMAYMLDSKIAGFNINYDRKDGSMAVAGHDSAQDLPKSKLLASAGAGVMEDSEFHAMRDALSPLDLAACFIAAAQHDYDHPARTNSFLVASRSSLAVLYNDRAVLENHHACQSWKLLLENEEFDFLCNMSATDVRNLRFTTLDLILATDLAKHFDIINMFKGLLSNGTLFLQTRNERMSVMQMCIKIADINGPAKAGHLHRKWAYLLTEEFYDQGREEASLNMPVSAFMSADNPMLPKLQISFISNLLKPMLDVYAYAGFMPGPYEVVDESTEQVAQEANPDGIPQTSLGILHNNLRSIIIQNTAKNVAFWQAIQKKEDEAAAGDASGNAKEQGGEEKS